MVTIFFFPSLSTHLVRKSISQLKRLDQDISFTADMRLLTLLTLAGFAAAVPTKAEYKNPPFEFDGEYIRTQQLFKRGQECDGWDVERSGHRNIIPKCTKWKPQESDDNVSSTAQASCRMLTSNL